MRDKTGIPPIGATRIPNLQTNQIYLYSITLDELFDGTIYQRVKSASLTAEGLVLLDEVVAGTYGLVLTTDISAGHILLSSCEGDLDDIANGTYGKVLTTDISAGHIILSSVEQSVGYRTTSDDEKTIWNGKEIAIHRGTTAPADTSKLWVDTSVTPNVWKRWTGAAWVKCTPTELDEIADGTTYSRVLTTDISAGHIKLSEVIQTSSYRTVTDANKTTWDGKPEDMDEIGQGSTYWKLAMTEISAGHVKLSACVSDATHRLTTDDEKAAWDAKPEDMDEIDMGITWGKPLKDQITVSGYLNLNANTVKDGEWYNESGVEIDAAHGINIYGVANALTTRATKTGTIQCYVGADGKFYAGAGKIRLDATDLRIMADGEVVKVIIDSDGIHSWGQTFHIYNGGVKVGGTTGDTWGPSFFAVSGKKARIGGDTVEIEVPTLKLFEFSPESFAPPDNATQDLGTGSKRWKELFVSQITAYTDIDPDTNKGADLGASGLLFDDLYIDDIFIDSGARPITTGSVDLGTSTYRFKNIYGTLILATDYYAPLVDGMLTMVGDDTGDIYIYSNGAWRANASGGDGGIESVVEDTTPQLGGNLDALTRKIYNLGAPTSANDAARKTEVDAKIGNVYEDTSPSLGGPLDADNKQISNLPGPSLSGDAASKTYVDYHDSLVEGKLNDVSVNDVTASRVFGTTYRNTSGKPKLCVVSARMKVNSSSGGGNSYILAYLGSSSASVKVDQSGLLITSDLLSNVQVYSNVVFKVPPNYYYKVSTSVGALGVTPVLTDWIEYEDH